MMVRRTYIRSLSHARKVMWTCDESSGCWCQGEFETSEGRSDTSFHVHS